MLDDPTFVALIDDDGGRRFINIRQIVLMEPADRGIALSLADGSRVTITGRAAVELFRYIATRSMAPDGTLLRGLLDDDESSGGVQ